MDGWQESLVAYFPGLGGYFTNCLLDVWLPLANGLGVPEHAVGHRWPVTECPGYKEAVKELAPTLPPAVLGLFVLNVYKEGAFAQLWVSVDACSFHLRSTT